MSQRIKIIKDSGEYKQGQTLVVENNVAHTLIEGGIATLTKDMVANDYKTKTPVRRAYRVK